MFWPKIHKYSCLKDEGIGKTENDEVGSPPRSLNAVGNPHASYKPTRSAILQGLVIWKAILLYAFAFIGVLALFGNIHIRNGSYIASSKLVEEIDGCDCGGSVAEAIGRGCKFDALAMAWLPPHCRDDELASEFDTKSTGPNGS